MQTSNSSVPFNRANLEFHQEKLKRSHRRKNGELKVTYIRFIESAGMAVQEEQIY